MSNDKVPTLYNKPAITPSPIDPGHAPVRDQSLFGKFVSGFMARLNTQTIQRNTEAVEALTAYRKEEGKLAEATLECDLKLEHYRKHRDDIIADDHERHRDQMEANCIERANAREERAHQMQLAQEKRKQELNAARFASATTQWGLDAFNHSLPHRQERVDQMYRTGALDAQLRAVLLDKQLDKVTAKEKPTAELAQEKRSDGERMLELLDLQIKNA